ncbi:MAG: tetratricopeptide repeat protein [Cardiobacterium sp.]
MFRYYFEGQYGAPDYSQAMEWLEWAAQGGVVEAQDALGSLYLYGENVPEDRKKARYWLRKAAAKSLPQAQYHLGCCI